MSSSSADSAAATKRLETAEHDFLRECSPRLASALKLGADWAARGDPMMQPRNFPNFEDADIATTERL
jgi:hypothetical protein